MSNKEEVPVVIKEIRAVSNYISRLESTIEDLRAANAFTEFIYLLEQNYVDYSITYERARYYEDIGMFVVKVGDKDKPEITLFEESLGLLLTSGAFIEYRNKLKSAERIIKKP